MAKKKPTKKATTKRAKKPVKKEEPMSKGFGHLTIRKNWQVRGGATVDGGNWDGWEE